jgi:hypothetical protein
MNNDHPQKISVREKVLARIEAEQLTIRSKGSFTAKVIALGFVAVLTLAVSILICTLIFFSLRTGDRGSLLGFGARGFAFFLRSFPWALLLLDIALIALLEWMLRQFSFGYRRPVLYLLLAILMLTISASFILDRKTSFNDALAHRADEERLPGPFGSLYRGAHEVRHEDSICRCVVVSIDGDTVTAEDRDAESTSTLTIVLPPGDPALGSLKIGDVIFVAGDRTASSTIHAFGIRALPEGAPRR